MDASKSSAVGKDTIRHFLYLNGRWRWRPTKKMRAAGFHLTNLGRGGPRSRYTRAPGALPGHVARALDSQRGMGQGSHRRRAFTENDLPAQQRGRRLSTRAVRLREAERKAKNITWTVDQEKRDDWPRAWRWIEPVFGDVDPRTVQPDTSWQSTTRRGSRRVLSRCSKHRHHQPRDIASSRYGARCGRRWRR